MSHHFRLKDEYAQRVLLRKLMSSWADSTAQSKRKRYMKESAVLFLSTRLKEKVIQALQERADSKIKNRMIIDRFRMRSSLVLKSEVLRAL